MEVHAHTHTARKKWTHYLWEFLMLFLAVFCGFLAENFREHKVEQLRERQYISSMMDDVKLDMSALNTIAGRRIRRKEMFDSLTLLLNSSRKDQFTTKLYFFCRHIQRLSPVNFTYNDRTIQQLKNGGNMRLIRKQRVTDAIVLYDAAVRDMSLTEERESNYMMQSLPHVYRIFDGKVMDLMIDSTGAILEPPGVVSLLQPSATDLVDFNGSFHSVKASNIVTLTKVKNLLTEGQKLLTILEHEY
ncbi:MAG: hypothetical protein ABIT05_08545 [Chitinophagaceae bacterium]